MNNMLRTRLQRMPPLQQTNLRNHQLQAITNLDRSLAENRPRALIQMAPGSGKTYMAVSSIYRLLKFAGAHRILYLVDRVFIAAQVMDAFQQFVTPDDGRRFTDLYNVQLPINNDIDPTASVCIVTIQRLYSILISQPYTDDLDSEAPTVDREDFDDNTSPKEVQYKPEIPIEFFDFVIIDECHRSIYQQWRPVLEYFDAFLIGLTATPNTRTLAFFDNNLLIEVPLARLSEDVHATLSLDASARDIIREQEERAEAGERVRCKGVVEQLTPRQLEVLKAFARGLHPADVAKELSISLPTVSTHTTVLLSLCREAWSIREKGPLDYRFLQLKFGRHFKQ